MSNTARGEEGQRKIREDPPHLLILDVMMEDFVSGFKVVERLRDRDPPSEYAAYSLSQNLAYKQGIPPEEKDWDQD